ncbi:MAG: signal peptidase I [Actinocatenispora sp.]
MTETHERHESADAQQPKRRAPFWRELPVLIVVAVLVAVVVRVFVLQTFWIPSGSMEHTLNVKDRVLVNKLVYDFRGPDRGEVIVFRSPVSWRTNPDEKDFIKRVIAVGGDHVVCCDRDNRITVNGHALDESSYLYRDAQGVANTPSEAPFDVTVPQGRIWVMGDHRQASGDSREHFLQDRDLNNATIPAQSVIGRAFALYWQPADDLGRKQWALRFDWLGVPDTFDGVPDP